MSEVSPAVRVEGFAGFCTGAEVGADVAFTVSLDSSSPSTSKSSFVGRPLTTFLLLSSELEAFVLGLFDLFLIDIALESQLITRPTRMLITDCV